jgi:hypothetical protein
VIDRKAAMSDRKNPLAEKELAKEHLWNEPQVQALREAYETGRLCLVLGAGVSKGCGLPIWNELTSRMLRVALAGLYEAVGPKEAPLHEKEIESTFKERVRPMVVRYVKAKLGPKYLDTVRTVLYQDPVVLSRTMKGILAMDRVHAILTQNFDDLLERFADELGVGGRYQPVYGAPMAMEANRIPIFHTHGFLPRSPARRGSDFLIFSEDDYHELLYHGHHWTDHVTIHLLARFTCLFVGSSGEDPNLRRLIDLARKMAVPPMHYLMLKPPAPLPRDAAGLIRYSASRRAVWDAFDHIGIEVLWIHNYDSDITKILRRIAGPPPQVKPI